MDTTHLGGSNGDAGLGGVVKQIVATSETLEELRVTPGGNDLDGGLDGVESEFETDLVVTLAGGTVGDELAAFTLSSAHLSAGNHRASQAGTEKVATLVDGIALCDERLAD